MTTTGVNPKFINFIPEVDGRLAALVAGGVASLHLASSGGGYEILFSVNQAHPKLGLVPYKKYYGDEFKDLTRKIRVSQSVSDESVDEVYATPAFLPDNLKDAKVLVETHRLMYCEVHGVETKLPKDSLDERDFEERRSLADVNARLFTVADSIGTTKLIGRIRSIDELNVPGATNLEGWWSESTWEQKVRLLTSRGKLASRSKALKRKLMELNKCLRPFLGTEEILEAQGFEMEDEESDSDGVNLGFKF